MKSLVIVMALILTACGGRVARPVETTTTFDDKLSCQHIYNEFEVNVNKITEITGERKDKYAYNVFMVGLFMDFSGSEKKEIEALHKRNMRLVELNSSKDCAPLPGVVETTEQTTEKK